MPALTAVKLDQVAIMSHAQKETPPPKSIRKNPPDVFIVCLVNLPVDINMLSDTEIAETIASVGLMTLCEQYSLWVGQVYKVHAGR